MTDKIGGPEWPGGVSPIGQTEKPGDRPASPNEFEGILKKILEGQMPPPESVPAVLGTLKMVLQNAENDYAAISYRISQQSELGEALKSRLDRLSEQIKDLKAAKLKLEGMQK